MLVCRGMLLMSLRVTNVISGDFIRCRLPPDRVGISDDDRATPVVVLLERQRILGAPTFPL